MSLFKSLDNLHDEEEPVLNTNASFSVLHYSLNSLIENIKNGTFSDIKIKTLIKYNINDLLDYSNVEKADTREDIQNLWTCKKFLELFISVFQTDEAFSNKVMLNYKRELNRLCFDYLFLNQDKEQEITNCYITIAKMINIQDIIPLTTMMPKDFAWQICVCRYSSFNAAKCVHNLDYAIISSGIDFSLKDIIYIYSRFYSDDYSNLFSFAMIDCYTPETDIGKKLYDRITITLLTILNSMTSLDIEIVLRRYTNLLLFSDIKTYRCNVRGLSEDYSRINSVVKLLEEKEVFVP